MSREDLEVQIFEYQRLADIYGVKVETEKMKSFLSFFDDVDGKTFRAMVDGWGKVNAHFPAPAELRASK